MVSLVYVEDGSDGATQKLTLADVCGKAWRVHKGKVCTQVKGCSCHAPLTHTLAFCRCSDSIACMSVRELSTCKGWTTDDCMTAYAVSNQLWSAECTKGAVALAMQQLAMEHQEAVRGLQLMQDPYMVKACKAYAKGSLTLVCCSTKVSTTTKGSINMQIDILPPSGLKVVLFAQPSIVLPFDAKDKKAEHSFIAPFWFAQQGDGPDGNMELKTKRVQVLGFVVHVPVLVNVSKIEADEFLIVKGSEVTAKAEGENKKEEENKTEDDEKPAAKKAKTKASKK